MTKVSEQEFLDTLYPVAEKYRFAEITPELQERMQRDIQVALGGYDGDTLSPVTDANGFIPMRDLSVVVAPPVKQAYAVTEDGAPAIYYETDRSELQIGFKRIVS